MRLLVLILATLGHQAFCSLATLTASLRSRSIPTGDGKKFLIVSIPGESKICYFALPSPAMRDLIVSGLNSPAAIAYDSTNGRLFVADIPDKFIFYYQIIALPDGKLITDGQQHLVATKIEATEMTVDAGGNLFITGQQKVDPPYTGLGQLSIFKHPFKKIEQGKTTVKPTNGMYNKGSNSQLFAPAAIVNDGANLYFTNSNGGKTAGSVVRASAGGGSINQVTMNEDDAFGIVLTERYIFYGASDGVFAVAKSGEYTNDPKLITNKIKQGASMVWDGDGTIYIADRATNGIFAMPSGDTNPHKVTELCNTGDDLYGLALLQLTADRGGARGSRPAVLLGAGLALSLSWHLWQ